MMKDWFEYNSDEEKNLGKALYAVVSKGNSEFVFVIDEWDALFREYKEDEKLQEDYILFLRGLFKNKDTTSRTIAAAYMTGWNDLDSFISLTSLTM